MKIWQRFTLLMVVVVSIICLSEYFLLQSARDALKKQIGRQTLQMGRKTLNGVLSQLNSALDQIRAFSNALRLQSITKLSNAAFENRSDLKAYIHRVDRDWIKGLQTPEIDSVLQNELSTAFRKYIEYYQTRYGYPVFSELFATNRFGMVIGASPRTSDFMQADEEWFRSTVSSKSGWLDAVEFDESSGAFALNANLRIEEADGELLGVLRVGINLKGIEAMINSSRIHSTYKSIGVTLVNHRGDVLFDSSRQSSAETANAAHALSFGANIASREPVDRTIRGQSGFLEYERGGIRYLSAYVPSPADLAPEGVRWGLVVDIELNEVFASVTELEKGFLITMLVSLLIIAVMGVPLLFSIIRPLHNLRDASAELAEGRLQDNVDIDRKDEIGELARSFKAMAERIFDQKRYLEQRVEERTRELSLAKEAAETASQAKSSFLARMSHELRTPLNAILGFSQIMIMNSKNSLTDTQQKNLERIYCSGNHLLDLINEVLDLSRIESGTLRLVLEKVELIPMVENVISLSQSLADQKNISIRFNHNQGRDVFVMADSLRLKQITMNLIANAIKYNKPGGLVEIFVEERENETVCLSFHDTGRGIPQEKQDRLFQPFERLGDDPDSEEGTGIGLAISRQLVEMMGGRIGAESVYGEGSCFFIELPRVAGGQS